MKISKCFCVVPVLLLLAFVMVGVSGASDIGSTVKEACSRCHSNKRICLNLGVKSESGWKSTVTKMVSKGAQLPADQIDAAAGYLLGLSPGAEALCQE